MMITDLIASGLIAVAGMSILIAYLKGKLGYKETSLLWMIVSVVGIINNEGSVFSVVWAVLGVLQTGILIYGVILEDRLEQAKKLRK